MDCGNQYTASSLSYSTIYYIRRVDFIEILKNHDIDRQKFAEF